MAGRSKRARKSRAIVVDQEGPDSTDRISRLPEDLLHKILSFMDASEIIQTCRLSTRWKNVWKTQHHLNFDRAYFRRMPEFCKFVTQFLSHRDKKSGISSLTISSPGSIHGSIDRPSLKKICSESVSQKVCRLEISTIIAQSRNLKCGGVSPIPHTLFDSSLLTHLCLNGRYTPIKVGKESWKLPNLKTLFLEQISLVYCCDKHSSKAVDIFSKLNNLETLSLVRCIINASQDFNLIFPQLENLSITSRGLSPNFIVFAPKLSSLKYTGEYGLRMSASNLCLDNINIDIRGSRFIYQHLGHKKRVFWEIINMFNQIRSVRFVTLSSLTVEVISWNLGSLANLHSPFTNLRCLKIERSPYWHESSSMDPGVIDYLTSSSPNSVFINESGMNMEIPYP